MAYDSARKRTVLFGGAGPNGLLGDTWEWDGSNWRQMKPAASPPARSGAAIAYDSARQRTVLFGGLGQNVLVDTWEWDGTNWQQIKPDNPLPSVSPGAVGMAYDSSRKRTVLFFSVFYGNGTYEWDGKNWAGVTSTTMPAFPASGAMAYDTVRKRTVLGGGFGNPFRYPFVSYQTWERNGQNWQLMGGLPGTTPSRGTGRAGHAMAYHSARRRTVLFGGALGVTTILADTWEWDGKNWTQIKPFTSPPARSGHAMAYDSARLRTVLFGGVTGNLIFPTYLADTWEYSGALMTDTSTVSIATGGSQKFTLDAGTPHGKRLYWLFGSVTGTTPGVTLRSAVGSVTIPLVPDSYTTITIAQPNTALLVKTKGALDASGQGQASLVVPKINNQNVIGLTLYHAYLVYDASNNFYMASNPVTLRLVK